MHSLCLSVAAPYILACYGSYSNDEAQMWPRMSVAGLKIRAWVGKSAGGESTTMKGSA